MKDYTVEKGNLLIFMNYRLSFSTLYAHIGEVKGFEEAIGCDMNCSHIDNCGRNFEKVIIKWEDRDYTNICCYNRKKGLYWLGRGPYLELIIIRDNIQIRFFNLFRKDIDNMDGNGIHNGYF